MKKYSLFFAMFCSLAFAQNHRFDASLIFTVAAHLDNACSAGNEHSNAQCLDRLNFKLRQLDSGHENSLSNIIESVCRTYAMPYSNEFEKPVTTLYKTGFLSRQIVCLESAFQSIAQHTKYARYADFHMQHCQQEYDKQQAVSFQSAYYAKQAYLSCLYSNLKTRAF